jgi:hypothetical protein
MSEGILADSWIHADDVKPPPFKNVLARGSSISMPFSAYWTGYLWISAAGAVPVKAPVHWWRNNLHNCDGRDCPVCTPNIAFTTHLQPKASAKVLVDVIDSMAAAVGSKLMDSTSMGQVIRLVAELEQAWRAMPDEPTAKDATKFSKEQHA